MNNSSHRCRHAEMWVESCERGNCATALGHFRALTYLPVNRACKGRMHRPKGGVVAGRAAPVARHKSCMATDLLRMPPSRLERHVIKSKIAKP